MKNIKILPRTIMTVSFLLFIVCAGIGTISYNTASNAIESRIREELPIIAQDSASYVSLIVNNYLMGIDSISNRLVIKSMDWTKQEPALKNDAQRLAYSGAGIGALDGNVKYTDGSAANLEDRDYYKSALNGKTSISDVIISRVTGKPVIMLASPITTEGKVAGVVVGRIDGDALSKITDKIKYGKKGYSYIITKSGALVAHGNREFVYKSRNFLEEGKTNPEFKKLSVMFERMVSGETGADEYRFMGSDRYFGFAPIQGTKWSIAVGAIKDDVFSDAYGLRKTFILVSTCFLILGIIVAYFLSKSIAVPINKLMRASIAISNGDLSASSDLNQQDEIGILNDSINTMVKNLLRQKNIAEEHAELARIETERAQIATNEAIAATDQAERAKAEGMLQAAQQLESIVEIVTSASEQLSAQIEQSSHGSEEQAQSIAETATAMEEMNATVLEVAKNASNAAGTADQAKVKAEEGAKMVGQVIHGIEQVQNQSQEMKMDMGNLGKQAEGIGQILNVISDIADQTNLLALNAAIEAARAGDAGRGFAVVADEVRKLAEKTMTATKEVGNAIRGIQDGTKKNIENVERTGKNIEEVTNLATNSGEALKQIVTLADKTTDQVRSIATASEQQSATSEEINRSIESVNRISSETTDAMRQSAQAVTELANQAQVLKRLIDEMKSDGGSGTSALPAGKKPLALGRG